MNADELMAGIEKSVVATKPAQEYCFLWIDHWSMCMTKSEWSGWAQAIGAFAALLLAIALPYIQARCRRVRSYVAGRDALVQLVAIYTAIQAQVQNGADLRQVLAAVTPNLDSGLRAFDVVRVDELPSACWPVWWSARANATQLQKLHETNGPNNGLLIVLGKYGETAKDLLKQFTMHKPSLFGF